MKTILFSFFLLLSLFSSAQTYKGYVGGSFGLSNPIGNYGDNSVTNINAGGAELGYNFSLNYRYKVNNYFGVGASIFGVRNDFGADAVSAELVRVNPGSTFSDFKVETTPYRVFGAQIEILGYVPINPKSSFVFSLSYGLAEMNSPEITTSTRRTPSQWATLHSASSTERMIGFGVGWTYEITDHLILMPQATILTSKFEFDNITSSNSSRNVAQYGLKQDFDVVNINIGLFYGF